MTMFAQSNETFSDHSPNYHLFSRYLYNYCNVHVSKTCKPQLLPPSSRNTYQCTTGAEGGETESELTSISVSKFTNLVISVLIKIHD